MVTDDAMPNVQLIDGVPSYALDQFTRTGNQINRAYIADDQELQRLLAQARIAKPAWPRTLGDALFLLEGGATVRRMAWDQAEHLRQPNRWLPAVAILGHHLPAILRHCQVNVDLVENVRRRHFFPSR